jgi:DNA-binding transcriptional LysR family regulator
LAASPAYLAARGMPSSPGDLPGHDLIVFEGVEATSEWRFADTVVRVSPRLSVNSGDGAIAAAEAGLGITRALSYQVREAVMAGRLVPLLTAFTPPSLPVNVVYPDRRLPSANVAAFVAAARARFRDADLGLPATS